MFFYCLLGSLVAAHSQQIEFKSHLNFFPAEQKVATTLLAAATH